MNFKQIQLVYRAGDKRKECIFNSSFENEDLKTVVDLHSEGGGLIAKIKLLPKYNIKIINIFMEIDESLEKESLIFLNGYQTWTTSREFRLNESIPKLRKVAWPIMSVYGDYGFYRGGKNNLQSYTYTYIRGKDSIKLIGSLTEKTGYTIFEFNRNEGSLKVIKDCSGLEINKEYNVFDLFFTEGEENIAFQRYFKAMKLKGLRVKHCTGWTSWYNYYTRITEDIIYENLSAFKSRNIPIDIFQIDDGYQEALGDWLNVNKKFPRGMKFLADEIKKAGYKAGIWLAPFVCDKKSIIYKEHPEWILKKAGFNPGWNGFFNVLDFYNDEVREYIKKVLDTVLRVWNYDMVKLDFLYAAALIPRKDKTRGQIMHEAMEFLREIAGDKIILGCGVPLGCSFGLVDYCRIGSDVALSWEDKFLNSLHYRERVSTVNSITSTIGRRHLNGHAFLNDPDVFIIRSRNNKLTSNQRYTLLLMNLIFGGLVFTSDNINQYTHEEMKLYNSIFPIKEKLIQSVDFSDIVKAKFSIDGHQYLAVGNLKSRKADFQLSYEDGNYYNKDIGLISKDTVITLEPYQSLCLIKTDEVNSRLSKSENIFML